MTFCVMRQSRQTLGGWENPEGKDKDAVEDWALGGEIGGEWFFHPNFSLSGDWEMEAKGLGDHRFVLGLQARWPGRNLKDTPNRRSMDLHRLAESEKRILYAERKNLTPNVRVQVEGSWARALQKKTSL